MLQRINGAKYHLLRPRHIRKRLTLRQRQQHPHTPLPRHHARRHVQGIVPVYIPIQVVIQILLHYVKFYRYLIMILYKPQLRELNGHLFRVPLLRQLINNMLFQDGIYKKTGLMPKHKACLNTIVD
jgi:hypothetical protein